MIEDGEVAGLLDIGAHRAHQPQRIVVEAYRYRFAPKFRIVSLLYSCKEGIHVDMYDLSLSHCLIYYTLFIKSLFYVSAKLRIISFLCKSFFLFLIIIVHQLVIMLQ